MLPAGVIIICHGSRGERGMVGVPETLREVIEGLKPLLVPGLEVVGAALQFNHPNLEEAVESLATRGVKRLVIMPYFLFAGRHITEDIPRIIEKLKKNYPEIQFVMASPLGLEDKFIDQVARCLKGAAPELWPDTGILTNSPEAIEKQSMEIVESRLSPSLNFSEDELMVVKRVVHACGDHQVASLIKFSPSATFSGLSAITGGSAIFTDVRMALAGINRHLAEACGCSVFCAMDEIKGQKEVRRQNTTRTAEAVYSLGERLNGAVVVIGNAPTALLALLDLIDNKGIAPALVVGMPVGFVQAEESKDELMKRDIPYITIVGTRGGSAMAVAAVNALLKIAVARNGHGRFNQKK
jgi:precorrin-8X/cobalt-precorrin-8 methylmutase